MDLKRHINYWRDGANEDFEVALILMEKGRLRHALFLAELALEKMLKAHVAKTTRDIPPRTHNLSRLVELAQLHLSEEQQAFIARFQEFCLEGRYPETFPVSPEPVDAGLKIKQCQEMIKWLMNQLD